MNKLIACSTVLIGTLLSACNPQNQAPTADSTLPQPASTQQAYNTQVQQPAAAPLQEPQQVTGAAQAVYNPPAPQPVVSAYVDPPIDQPPPVEVSWAPPPMLVETPPPPPDPYYTWIGGYWTWEGNWIWAHGRWAPPPRPGYLWHNPYYEHRHGGVVFINGFWGAPGVSFVAPGLGVHIDIGIPGPGVVPGPAPIGPDGVFIPAPPGSHLGLIVPAPIGTAPAVVTSAPPIVNRRSRCVFIRQDISSQ